ncbi:MAG: anion permease [Deltaproteobacteria bacterium]|nr:anion permease [Deltaproteobacteria bacterium]
MEHGATVSSVKPKPFSWPWWVGGSGQRPIIILSVIIFFVTLVYVIPTPQSMINLVKAKDVKGAKYKSGTHNFLDSYNKLMKKKHHTYTSEEVAHKMIICIAMLFSVAIFWGTEAITLAASDILVGVILYIFCILPINDISRGYMKDAVFFILGVLILAAAVGVTGLDRRSAD